MGLIYKLNFDATMFVGIKASGFRAVVPNGRRSYGSYINKRASSVDNEEAKVLACKCAVEFVMEAGFKVDNGKGQCQCDEDHYVIKGQLF